MQLQVNKEGLVFRPDGTKPKPYVNSCGYLRIKYQNKAYLIHRLVAETYIPNPDNKSDVNHKDGNKLNNKVENLEWCSRTENLYHSLRNGLHDNPEVPVRGINLLTGEMKTFVSQAEAARQTGAHQENISKCLSGYRNSAGNWRWFNYEEK